VKKNLRKKIGKYLFFCLKCSNIETIWTLDAFLRHMESFLNILEVDKTTWGSFSKRGGAPFF
jgi:hypothetical protein